jgi:glycosyl transferase family 25
MGSLKDAAVNVAFALYNLSARQLPPRERLPDSPYEAISAYFDAVWVLTIPRNIERQEVMRRRLNGLDFEFVNGVDGKSLGDGDPRIDVKAARALYGRAVRINELACTMSHLEMFKTIRARGLKRVLIFEDDAFLLPAGRRWTRYCLERLPADWEVFYLGYRFGELRGFQRELQKSFGIRRGEPGTYSRSVGRGLRTAAQHDFTHAYAVTYDGAGKLLDGAYPVFHTADGWLGHRIASGQIKAYLSVPKLFAQESGGSSIHRVDADARRPL